MLINIPNGQYGNVEFVSYDGKYPNLCRGVLILKIEGKEYKFGHHYQHHDWKTGKYKDEDENNPNFPEFWHSGGCITSDYEALQNEWEIDYNKIPEQFQKYAAEFDDVFNSNVEHGYCGGCI